MAIRQLLFVLVACKDICVAIATIHLWSEQPKASGAFTIGLADGYEQHGADAYAATVKRVVELIKDRD